eukprot:366552-Chlamydomonas_euryale.AAC.14
MRCNPKDATLFGNHFALIFHLVGRLGRQIGPFQAYSLRAANPSPGPTQFLACLLTASKTSSGTQLHEATPPRIFHGSWHLVYTRGAAPQCSVQHAPVLEDDGVATGRQFTGQLQVFC